MDYIFSIGVFIVFALIVVAKVRTINGSISIDIYRSQAKKQFLEYQARSSTPQLAFIGAEAKIIKSDGSMIKNEGIIEAYSLTCYARNCHGEYFMFVSNHESRPFFKHISHTNAKIILGEDFCEPAQIQILSKRSGIQQ